MKITTKLLLIALAFCFEGAKAATIVNWRNTEGAELRNMVGVLLTDGVSPGNYDGAIVQLGYYTMATVAMPFAGEWAPLLQSLRSIGDKGPPDQGPGRFRYSEVFAPDEAGLLIGTPLSIRFYDSNSVETSTRFNAVSDTTAAWGWIESPVSNVTIDAVIGQSSSLIWQGGSDSAFRTTIMVPEPGPALLCLCGALTAFLRRRRPLRAT